MTDIMWLSNETHWQCFTCGHSIAKSARKAKPGVCPVCVLAIASGHQLTTKDHVMRRPSYKEQMAKLPPIITQAKGAKPSKPQLARGLGDLIEGALSKVGITHERVDAWLGRPCGCAERKERLNRLFSWARSIEETPSEEAAAKVEEIFNS